MAAATMRAVQYDAFGGGARDLKVTARRFSQLFLTKGGRRAVDSWVGGFGSSWPPLVPFI